MESLSMEQTKPEIVPEEEVMPAISVEKLMRIMVPKPKTATKKRAEQVKKKNRSKNKVARKSRKRNK